jgi:hypothetical protein
LQVQYRGVTKNKRNLGSSIRTFTYTNNTTPIVNMRSLLFLSSSLLFTSSVFASANAEPEAAASPNDSAFVLARSVHEIAHSLMKRASQFVPNTTTAEGSTCADAFGAGYLTCREASGTSNRLCYNPSIGQTCCESSWACPMDSFCLISGSCCPNGTEAAACASALASSATSQTVVPTLSSLTSASVTGGSSGNVEVKPTGTATSAGAQSSKTPNAAAPEVKGIRNAANVGLAGLVLGAVIML